MDKNQNITIDILANTEDVELKLKKIKKLLEDIKTSGQEVKELFKHLF